MNIIIGILVALVALAVSVVAVKFLATWAIITIFIIVITVVLYFAFRHRRRVVTVTRPFGWYVIVPIFLVFGAYLLYALNFPELRQATARLSHNLMMDGVFGLQKQSLETENEQGTFGTMKGDVTPCDANGKAITIQDGEKKSTLIAKKGRQIFAYDLEPHYLGKGKTEGMAKVMLLDENGNFVDGPEVYVPLRMTSWKKTGKIDDDKPGFTVSRDYVTPVSTPDPVPAAIAPATGASSSADYDVDVIITKKHGGKKVSATESSSPLCNYAKGNLEWSNTHAIVDIECENNNVILKGERTTFNVTKGTWYENENAHGSLQMHPVSKGNIIAEGTMRIGAGSIPIRLKG